MLHSPELRNLPYSFPGALFSLHYTSNTVPVLGILCPLVSVHIVKYIYLYVVKSENVKSIRLL
jgi:hypothetical protein